MNGAIDFFFEIVILPDMAVETDLEIRHTSTSNRIGSQAGEPTGS